VTVQCHKGLTTGRQHVSCHQHLKQHAQTVVFAFSQLFSKEYIYKHNCWPVLLVESTQHRVYFRCLLDGNRRSPTSLKLMLICDPVEYEVLSLRSSKTTETKIKVSNLGKVFLQSVTLQETYIVSRHEIVFTLCLLFSPSVFMRCSETTLLFHRERNSNL
jgi:hypothetical protein